MAPDYKAAAHEWFEKADIDEKSMRILLAEDGPRETICILAEQWVEKYLKGYLTLHRNNFRYVHDLLYLVNLCREIEPGFDSFKNSLNEISDLYLGLRYPIDLPPSYDVRTVVTKSEAIVRFIKSEIQKAKN